MRTLGIDFGEKRIGLALSDPEGRLAVPLGTLERRSDRQAAYHIAEIVRSEEIGLLVLGEPLDPAGEPGSAALRVRRFAARLERVCRRPVRLIDETLTTVEAAQRLAGAGLDSPARRDAVAAQILLQEALDHPLGGGGGSRS